MASLTVKTLQMAKKKYPHEYACVEIFRGLGELDLGTPFERYDGMPLVLTPEYAKGLTLPEMPYLLEIQTPILTFLALSSLSQLRESSDHQCWYIPKMENYHLQSTEML